MNPQLAQWFILLIVNIPVYLGLGRLIFNDWNDFFETLRLWSNLDWIMTIKKQWDLDRWDTSKLPVFLLLCMALVVCEHAMFGNTPGRPAVQQVGL